MFPFVSMGDARIGILCLSMQHVSLTVKTLNVSESL